ncbi:hypothetical protein [Mesorhizobium japonicum]|uniref:hypothetical protein n=1 Tax=Mesorhizobium japonicum TaxID=2066070 RepID=UPI0005CB5A52|nr:hypothetical protein [Mesorhizobium japonicum]
MGWLGWTEEQTLRADVNAILAGLNGRGDMIDSIICAVFGEPEKPAIEITAQPISEAYFDAMFAVE